MTVSPNLEIINVHESQSAKATTTNTALLALEQALTDQLAVSTDGGDVTLPYDDANDLSDRTALRFISLLLQTGAAAPFNVIHPPKRHMFFVTNATAHDATIKTATGTGVVIGAGGAQLVYCNGSDVASIMVVAASGTVTPSEPTEPTGDTNPEWVMETGARSLADADFAGRRIIESLSDADVTFTIPAGLTGTGPLNIVQAGAGVVTVAGAAGVTVKSGGGFSTSAQNWFVTVLPRGGDVYYLVGAPAAAG